MTEARVPSSVFRVTFNTLTEPVAVTVLGRVIGWWTPVPRPVQDQTGASPARAEAPDGLGTPAPQTSPPVAEQTATAAPKGPPTDGSTTGMTQAARDKVLRRVAKGASG